MISLAYPVIIFLFAMSNYLNLTGKRFGRLVAVEMTDKRNKRGSVIWKCICDCGNEVEVAAEGLAHGNNTSCGCRKREIQDSIGDTLAFVDGTCVDWLRSRKKRSDNTSGYTGIYRVHGKWKAGIGLMGKRYHIGTYDTFLEAKEARLAAEQILHEGFVSAWDKWKEYASTHPAWSSENPFEFNVSYNRGVFVVSTPCLDSMEKRIINE